MRSNIIHASSALLPNGWADNTRLHLGNGIITAIETGVSARGDDHRVDHLIPGMSNHHSHAFQRSMSGLAEVRGHATDTFWTWRDVMYRFALAITPDQMEAIAAQLYIEMLEVGFCRVGEFHYLHNDCDGQHYGNIGEMSERIVAAALEAGIGLTLLPSFYAHSDFGGIAPLSGQRRFINDLDSFEKNLAQCRNIAKASNGVTVGVAPHSLRAVTPQELEAIIAMAGTEQIHMHVAEQQKEVEDCISWSGQRPLEWLMSHAPVNQRWCLIHATHLTSEELNNIVKSDATVGLCPITEGNLGDGIFPADVLLQKGGKFGIGTDSNVSLSVADELRQLEYSQRLNRKNRSVIADQGQSTGQTLFSTAQHGGQSALAAPANLVVGNAATFVTLDTAESPWISKDRVLDAWIFGQSLRTDSVWVDGIQRVSGGHHIARKSITHRYQQAMTELFNQTGLQ